MNQQPRCLVLGGKGFIGSHLVNALLDRGFLVRVFDRPSVALLQNEVRRSDVEWCDGDFASEADIGEVLLDCDICFHLVSTTLPKSSNADPIFDVETNLMGTLRLLNHAVKLGVRKIVFVSSGGTVYGTPLYLPIDERHPTNPLCSYGITKLSIEKYLGLYHQLHGLDYTVLRLSNPYGERQRIYASQGAVAVFLGKVLRGERVEIWGDGSVVRDYIYIGDVITALLGAVDYRGTERVLNIGAGSGHSLNEVLAAIEQVTGCRADVHYTAGRPFDVPASVLSIERAKNALGWAPQTTFSEGIERMAQWLKTRGPNET